MHRIKQPELSIYSKVSLNKQLMDNRPYSFGIQFGRVRDVARQYGIKIQSLKDCHRFSAPQLRLQLFIEKLHFSKTPYSERPF